MPIIRSVVFWESPWDGVEHLELQVMSIGVVGPTIESSSPCMGNTKIMELKSRDDPVAHDNEVVC